MRLRDYRSGDLNAVYDISLKTGDAGTDATALYREPKLIGHIYVGPYVQLEPTLAIVAEDSEGVVGYAVGTPNTPFWEDRLEREWWPHLRAIHADPGPVAMADWGADEMRAQMIHHPPRVPDGVVSRYPAHLHLNLLPHAQGQGMGRRLFEAWMGKIEPLGPLRVHVGVGRANGSGLAFWTRMGFHEIAASGSSRTNWMGRDGQLAS